MIFHFNHFFFKFPFPIASRLTQPRLSGRFFGKHIQSRGKFVQRFGHSTPGRAIVLQAIGAIAFKKELFIVSKGQISGKRI